MRHQPRVGAESIDLALVGELGEFDHHQLVSPTIGKIPHSVQMPQKVVYWSYHYLGRRKNNETFQHMFHEFSEDNHTELRRQCDVCRFSGAAFYPVVQEMIFRGNWCV